MATSPAINNAFYFRCHVQEVLNRFNLAETSLIPVINQLIVEFLLAKEDDLFGSQKWLSVFKVRVDPCTLPLNIYDQWFRADPSQETRLVCDSYIPPVLVPSFISPDEKSRPSVKTSSRTPFCIAILNHIFHQISPQPVPLQMVEMVQKDQSAHSSPRKIGEGSPLPVSSSRWIIMSKDIVRRTEPFNPEYTPLALDVLTVLCARYSWKTERHLLGGTYSYCRIDRGALYLVRGVEEGPSIFSVTKVDSTPSKPSPEREFIEVLTTPII